MSTLPQQEQAATISFRCPQDWKIEIGKKLLDMGKTTQQAAIEALSEYTGVPVPPEAQQDAA